MATLLIRNKADTIKDGRICKQQYDVIEVFPDNIRNYGLSGSRGREDPTNGMGNFIHLRVHIPGISTNLKGYIEHRHQEYDFQPEIGEFNKDRKPIVDLPRRYYMDIDSLPDWAKLNLAYGGECTLPPNIAYDCIKRRSDNERDPNIYTHLKVLE